MMMYMLGVLEEEGGLKNFTTLSQAVLKADESMQRIRDPRALTRLGRMLDHVFSQAYRGEKPMSALAERVESVLEMFDMDALAPAEDHRPEPAEAVEAEAPRDPWATARAEPAAWSAPAATSSGWSTKPAPAGWTTDDPEPSSWCSMPETPADEDESEPFGWSSTPEPAGWVTAGR